MYGSRLATTISFAPRAGPGRRPPAGVVSNPWGTSGYGVRRSMVRAVRRRAPELRVTTATGVPERPRGAIQPELGGGAIAGRVATGSVRADGCGRCTRRQDGGKSERVPVAP